MKRLALLLLVLAVAACARPPRTADDALAGAKAAYGVACVAFEVADAANAAWLSSLDAPTDSELARGEKVVAALESVHAALERSRAALVAGEDALREVREALVLLRGVSTLLGDRAPPELATALDGAERLLGGAQ